jgi:hypothetical protein
MMSDTPQADVPAVIPPAETTLPPGLLRRLHMQWRIRRAIHRLVYPNPGAREEARARLRALSPACWPQLRNTAFRPRTSIAVAAADLLEELGDPQGLIALLSQYADPYMHGWYGADIRTALQRIGMARIVTVLEHSLERLEAGEVSRHLWSLSVAVYALFALQSLRGSLPDALWLRALTVSHPDFDDLRTCRSILPSQSFADLMYREARPPSEDWRVGTTLVAVRRSAVETLLFLAPGQAFDLLRIALAHQDLQVQISAIYGLRRLRDPRALVLLQPIAADRRHPLCRDARRAIEAFGTRLPDELTLMRGSALVTATPDQLLRPASVTEEVDPDTLLRASNTGIEAEDQQITQITQIDTNTLTDGQFTNGQSPAAPDRTPLTTLPGGSD